MKIICCIAWVFSLMSTMNWEPNKEYLPPKRGEPELHRAARVGDHKSIQNLIRSGADINAVFDIQLDPGARECPATPLMVAAGSGDGANVETVRLLLEAKADPKIRLKCMTAADFAARGLGWNYKPGGDAARLSVLLEAGSPLDIDGPNGSRLVADIARLGDAERLAIMLKLGAPANAIWKRDEGEQADMLRIMNDTADTSELFKDLSPETREEMLAGMIELRRELVEKAASAPYSHEIPLFCAAEGGNIECIKVLLVAGADVRQRDNQSRTALWHAGSLEAVRLLIKKGLSLDDVDEYGWPPLVDCLDSVERTKMLIAAGANVNATHDKGYTVFMSAVSAMGRNLETMKALIAAGADPHAVSELGFNAFHAAVDVDGEANEEASVRQTLGYLKQLKVNIEHRNKSGSTPLARAIERGMAHEVQVLCELGANVNAHGPHRDCYEETCKGVESPLIFGAIAAIVDSDKKLAALVKAGATMTVKNPHGQSPLEFAKACLARYEDDEPSNINRDLIRQAKACIRQLSRQ